ncbi:transposase [Spirillospora sp. NPDC048832]
MAGWRAQSTKAWVPPAESCGTTPVDDRAVFTAIVYVLTSGCAWRHLPGEFGVSVPTAHRRFTTWTRAELWLRLHPCRAGRARGAWAGGLNVGDRGRRRGPREKAGRLTGPNPVDRGKKGSEPHVLSDAAGLPLVVAVSAANVHGRQALKQLLLALPTIRSRRGPRQRRPVKLRAERPTASPSI